MTPDAVRIEIVSILDVLDAVKSASDHRDRLTLLWPCPRCRVGIGAWCLNPRGERLRVDVRHSGFHAPRLDVMCNAWNGSPVHAWRQDLQWCAGHIHEARELRALLHQVKSCRLYRQLQKAGE